MLPLVRVAASGLRERLPAHAALVRLLPGVGELVFLEAGHLGETFRAPVELARVGSLPGVCPDVVLEVPGRREGLAAVGVRADEGSLPSVDPPVDVEVLRGVEPFPAAGEVALARAVRDVYLLDVGAEVGGERERPAATRVVALVRLVLERVLLPVVWVWFHLDVRMMEILRVIAFLYLDRRHRSPAPSDRRQDSVPGGRGIARRRHVTVNLETVIFRTETRGRGLYGTEPVGRGRSERALTWQMVGYCH